MIALPAASRSPILSGTGAWGEVTQPRERVPAVVVRAGDGELVPVAGVEHLFKLTGEQTGGRFGIEEFPVAPSTLGARPHVHWAHDEYFYVLDGELTVATDSGEVVLQQVTWPVRRGARSTASATPTAAARSGPCACTPRRATSSTSARPTRRPDRRRAHRRPAPGPAWQVHRQPLTRRSARRSLTGAQRRTGPRRSNCQNAHMIGRWHGLVVDCPDPDRLALFYQELLGMIRVQEEADWVVIGDAPDRPGLAFARAADFQPPSWPDPAVPQQMHVDVRVADLDVGEQQVLERGARRLPGGGASFRVFADPAGHPFCLGLG